MPNDPLPYRTRSNIMKGKSRHFLSSFCIFHSGLDWNVQTKKRMIVEKCLNQHTIYCLKKTKNYTVRVHSGGGCIIVKRQTSMRERFRARLARIALYYLISQTNKFIYIQHLFFCVFHLAKLNIDIFLPTTQSACVGKMTHAVALELPNFYFC